MYSNLVYTIKKALTSAKTCFAHISNVMSRGNVRGDNFSR